MDRLRIKLGLIATIISLATAEPAFAAQDGSLGATSSGSSSLELTVADMVMITNINDLNFGTFSGAGNLEANDDVCIYRNEKAGRYKITASSTEGAFKVKDGTNNEIEYAVFYNDKKGTNGEAAMKYNTASSTQTGASTDSLDCNGGSRLNGNFHVLFTEANLQVAPAGTYKGTLVLTVEPI